MAYDIVLTTMKSARDLAKAKSTDVPASVTIQVNDQTMHQANKNGRMWKQIQDHVTLRRRNVASQQWTLAEILADIKRYLLEGMVYTGCAKVPSDAPKVPSTRTPNAQLGASGSGGSGSGGSRTQTVTRPPASDGARQTTLGGSSHERVGALALLPSEHLATVGSMQQLMQDAVQTILSGMPRPGAQLALTDQAPRARGMSDIERMAVEHYIEKNDDEVEAEAVKQYLEKNEDAVYEGAVAQYLEENADVVKEDAEARYFAENENSLCDEAIQLYYRKHKAALRAKAPAYTAAKIKAAAVQKYVDEHKTDDEFRKEAAKLCAYNSDARMRVVLEVTDPDFIVQAYKRIKRQRTAASTTAV